MKKFIALALALTFVLVIGAVSASGITETNAEETLSLPDENEVFKARLENMLNANLSYGDDFDSVKILTENAAVSLSEYAEDGFVSADTVAASVKNLYGIDIFELADEGTAPAVSGGKIEVPAKGVTEYRHKITSLNKNEDGTVTVYTSVTEILHDGDGEVFADAITVFVPNEESAFGYVILSSELLIRDDEIMLL